MEMLAQMAGYLLSVLAVAAIVFGIEALNERCPHAPFARGGRVPATVAVRPVVLRRPRS